MMALCEAEKCPCGIGIPGRLMEDMQIGKAAVCEGCFYFHKNYPKDRIKRIKKEDRPTCN